MYLYTFQVHIILIMFWVLHHLAIRNTRKFRPGICLNNALGNNTLKKPFAFHPWSAGDGEWLLLLSFILSVIIQLTAHSVLVLSGVLAWPLSASLSRFLLAVFWPYYSSCEPQGRALSAMYSFPCDKQNISVLSFLEIPAPFATFASALRLSARTSFAQHLHPLKQQSA